MAINFPTSPTVGDTYTVNSVVYTWDGTKWNASTGFVSYTYADKIQEGDSSAEIVDNGGDAYFVVTNNAVEKFRVNVDGQLGTPYAGNASSPALYMGGDINSGLYSAGADQVAVATNGVGRLFVDASGNVSIGGSTAGVFGNQKLAIGQPVTGAIGGLTIYSDAAEKGYIAFGRGTTGTASYRGLLTYDQSTEYLSVHTAASEKLRITSAGFVGIGTSSPGWPLDVNGGARSTGTNAIFTLSDRSTGTGDRYGIYSNGNTFRVYDFTAAADRVVIDSSGRVGIGTTSPGAPLQVYGAIWCGDTSPSTGGMAAIYNDGNSVSFEALSASNPAVKRNILLAPYGGNVGIGTTSPNVPLDVYRASGAVTVRVQSGAGVGDLAHDGTNLYLANGANGPIQFWNNGSEKARIDSSGRLLVGTSTASGGNTSEIEVHNAGGGAGQPVVAAYSYSTTATTQGFITLNRSRGTSVLANVIVQDNDLLGAINWQGNNGSYYLAAASITGEVDGTPAFGSIPGALVFSTTANGASSPTPRMTIDSAGAINHSAAGGSLITTLYSGSVTDNGPSGNAKFAVTLTFPDSGHYFICEIIGYHPVYTGPNEYYRVLATKRTTSNTFEANLLEDRTTTGTIAVTDTTVTITGRRPRSTTGTAVNSNIRVIFRGTVLPTSVTIANS